MDKQGGYSENSSDGKVTKVWVCIEVCAPLQH